MNKLIAIVGMCGSGKSVATEIFKNYRFSNVYFGSATFEEMKKRGLEITPENEKLVREDLRSTGDKGIYAKICEPQIEQALKNNNVTIESMYSWSEYKYIKEKYGDNFKVLCIATGAELRHQRLAIRPVRPLSFEQSKDRDYSEIENIEKGGPIAIADYYITNNGTEEEFKEKVEKFVKEYLKG